MEYSDGGGNEVEAGQRRMTQRDFFQLLYEEGRDFFRDKEIARGNITTVVRELGAHLRRMFADVVLLDPPEAAPIVENGKEVPHVEMMIRFIVLTARIEIYDLFDKAST